MTDDDDEDRVPDSQVTPQLQPRRKTTAAGVTAPKSRYEMPLDERDTLRRHPTADGDRRRHAEMYAAGLPSVIVETSDDTQDTGPVAMMEAIELDDDDLQQMDRLRRDSPNPYVAMYKLTKLNRQLRHEVRELRRGTEAFEQREISNNQERADQILELLNRPPDERTADMQRDIVRLTSAINKLEREFSPIRSFSKWALGVAGAAALAIAIFLYQRGFGEGGNSVRMELLEKTVSKLDGELARIERLFYSDKGHAP